MAQQRTLGHAGGAAGHDDRAAVAALAGGRSGRRVGGLGGRDNADVLAACRLFGIVGHNRGKAEELLRTGDGLGVEVCRQRHGSAAERNNRQKRLYPVIGIGSQQRHTRRSADVTAQNGAKARDVLRQLTVGVGAAVVGNRGQVGVFGGTRLPHLRHIVIMLDSVKSCAGVAAINFQSIGNHVGISLLFIVVYLCEYILYCFYYIVSAKASSSSSRFFSRAVTSCIFENAGRPSLSDVISTGSPTTALRRLYQCLRGLR